MFSDMTEMLGEENPERIAVIDNTSGSSLHLNSPTLLGSIPTGIVCVQISILAGHSEFR